MIKESVQLQSQVQTKARELGISEEIFTCAFEMICQNRNLVNAIDNRVEMDDYIYRAILKQAFEKRKKRAEDDLNGPDTAIAQSAQKDLYVLSREELTT